MADASSSTASPTKPRKRRRVVVWVLGTIALVLLIVVLALPMIAGWLAPGIAEKSINAMLNGRAEVRRVGLSWTGGQRIGPVEVFDAQGQRVADMTIMMDRGLLGLARAGIAGPLDLGQVKISGSANLVRGADGKLNIETLMKPSASAPSTPAPGPSKPAQPASLPKGLRATLVIDALAVKYTDQSPAAAVKSVEIPKFAGTAGIADGKAQADLSGAVLYGPGPAASTPGGSLTLKGAAEQFTDASGVLTLDRAIVDVKVDLSNLAIAAADALAGTGMGLTEAIGQTLNATVIVKGSAGKASADLAVKSSGINADVGLLANAGVLSTARAGIVEIKTAGARRLLKLDDALQAQNQVAIGALPELKLTLDQLRLALPFDPNNLAPRPLDLRGSSVAVGLSTTELRGQVRVPDAGGPGSMREFRVAPLSLRVESADLAKDTTIKGGTTFSLAGQPAGALVVDMLAQNPLDDKGAPRPAGPTQVRGQIAFNQLATAIAQPLVESAGLDLVRGVGPTLDVVVSAKADPSTAASGAIPPTEVDLSIMSTGVTGGLALTLDATSLRTRDDKGSITVRSLADLVRGAAQKSGVELVQGGSLAVRVRQVNVPLAEKGIDQINKLGLDAGVDLSGLALRLMPAAGQSPGEPIRLDSLSLGASTGQGAIPKLAINGAGSHAGSPFTIAGGFDLVGLKGFLGGKQPIFAVTPTGSLKIENLPTTLVSMFAASAPPPPPTPGQPPAKSLDIARLVRDAIGPKLSLNLASSKRSSGGEGVDVALGLAATSLNGELMGSLGKDAATLAKLDFKSTLSPALAGTLLEGLGSSLQSTPQLAGPAMLAITAKPVTVPFGADFKPDFARAGDASFRVEIAGKTLVNNIVVKDESGQARDIGPLGLEDVLIAADFPLKALAPGSAPQLAKFDVKAGVLGDATRRIIDLDAGGQVNLAGGKPQGDLNARLNLNVTDTQRVDTLLASPSLVAGAVGENFKVNADAVVSFPQGGAAAGAAVPFSRAIVNANIASPRLKTTKPLKLTATSDVVSLDQELALSWTMGPAWANRYLLNIPAQPPAARSGQAPEPIRIAEMTEWTVSVPSLAASMPKGDAQGPLKFGVFKLEANVRSPQANLIVGGVPTSVKDLVLRAGGGQEPGRLGFRLVVVDAGQGLADGGKPALEFTGRINDAYEPNSGKPTPDAARITVNGNAQKISTALLDALAQQRGVLLEALGPTAAATINAEGLNKQGGTLAVSATSPRAELALKGRIENGVFITEGEPQVKLLEISPALATKFVDGLPHVASFEKRLDDGPAIIQATGLRLPMNGDLSRLDGRVTIDIGTARFQTTDVFGKLLKFGGGKAAGVVGNRIEPFVVNISKGVAEYERFALPLGEFRLSTAGKVDLVNRQLDVTTFIPFGALSDETAKIFRLPGIGGVIEQSAMMPFRTRGSFDRPDTKPDLERFGKEAARNLTRPENLGDTLKGILDRKKDQKK